MKHGVTRAAQARTEDQRRRDLTKIKHYCDLDNKIQVQAQSGSHDAVLLHLTTELLCLNPEHYTVWNIRRRCLATALLSSRSRKQSAANAERGVSEAEDHDSDVTVLKSELAFTVPLLKAFPKCYWLWGYRQWILSQVILRLTVHAAGEIWQTEFSLTSLMLDKDQRNFHAWGYRGIVVSRLESQELRGRSMVEEEFTFTTTMIQRNLSNFSAWHYRSQLIPRLLRERDADQQMRTTFLAEELSFVRGGLDLGPEDQSLWYYHHFLMSHIFDEGDDGQGVVCGMDVQEKVGYVRYEIDEIKDLLDDYADVKWVYEALVEYTLALERLEQRAGNSNCGPPHHLQKWLSRLKVLDPMRIGRWNDFETQLELQIDFSS